MNSNLHWHFMGALSVKLIQEEVAYLEDPYVPHRIVGHQ